MTHVRALRAMGACSEAIVFVEKCPDLKSAWNACERGDWMLWIIQKTAKGQHGSAEHRRITAVACKCARLVAHLWKSPECKKAVALAERFAAGEDISRKELRAYAAYDAYDAYDADYDAYDAAYAAYDAYAAAYAADAAYAAAYAACAAYAADAAAYAVDAARAATLKRCAEFVREYFPEPPMLENEPRQRYAAGCP